MNLNKFKELLSVPSKTYQEDKMVKYLMDELSQMEGIEVVCDDHKNIYVTKGTLDEGEYYPMFISHTDTVHNLVDEIIVKEEYLLRPYTFGKEFGDKQLISFIDLFLTPNVDYIEIKQELTTYREINRPIIKKEIKKIIKKVKKMNENTELYDKIASNGYNKINKLTNEHIYIYIYIGIFYFSKHYKI